MWQRYLDQLGDVLYTLRRNKGRSILTLLGMIIGAGSLVLLAGLLTGGEEALRATSQGVTEADVIRVDNAQVPAAQRGRTERGLSGEDLAELRHSRPLHLGAAEGVLQSFGQTAYYRDEKQRVMLFGGTERSLELYRLGVRYGRFLDAADLSERHRVCVIGHQLWKDLLKEPADLAGAALTVGGVRYQVIGVLSHKPVLGGAGLKGMTWDGRVIVPSTTLQSVVRGTRRLDRLFLRVLPQGQALLSVLDPARRLTRALLLRRHYGVENFKVDRDLESKQQEELIFLVINVLMLCTAGLSLLAGGINIMNIMLVTVKERTREIGVRRALGATPGNILGQFLLESAFVAGLGGILGVLGGAAGIFIASKGLSALLGAWAAHYEVWAIALALVSTVLCGVVFGLYPAWRAARLDPVVALRYE